MYIFTRAFWIRMWIATSQWWNTAFNGDPDETLSSRCGKEMQSGHPSRLARVVTFVTNLFDRNHVYKAIDPTEGSDV